MNAARTTTCLRPLMLGLVLFICATCPAVPAMAGALPEGIIRLDGQTAPALKVSDYDGKQYELKDSRGQWVFVHFWASWCGPCRREMPALVDLMEIMQGTDMRFVLINTAEDEDTIFRFLGSIAPSLHSYMDRDGSVTERWSPRGLPATFFVDPDGRLQYLALGGRPWMERVYLSFIKGLLRR